jgi:hypothetical protein
MAISRDCPCPAVPRPREREEHRLRRVASKFGPLTMTLAAVALASTGAAAEIISKEEMLHGITTTRDRCAATEQTLWLSVDRQDFCVRYYLSTAGGEGTRPVVFLSGDRFGTIRNWQWVPASKDNNAGITFDPTNPASHGDVNTNDLVRTADAFSKLAKTTAIYLARMGVDGTSGNHVFRKTLLELHLMNAALDALKQRYGFEGFHLAGQSGGSTLVTGLAGLRHDVACAVSGSGRLGISGGGSSKEPARTHIDPLGFVPSIAHNRLVHFFMITDSADRTVPARQQTPFAENMSRAGRSIPQYFVTAIDDFHHGVVSYTELVTAGCALGRSEAEIATAVRTMVKRNAAYDEQRRKEIALFGKNGTTRQSTEPPAGSPARTGGKRA